ncbi:MAG: hypothetical protein PHU14_05645 [Methylovulum sp.]|nr:hypothetical protein [Methylovulum sp.]
MNPQQKNPTKEAVHAETSALPAGRCADCPALPAPEHTAKAVPPAQRAAPGVPSDMPTSATAPRIAEAEDHTQQLRATRHATGQHTHCLSSETIELLEKDRLQAQRVRLANAIARSTGCPQAHQTATQPSPPKISARTGGTPAPDLPASDGSFSCGPLPDVQKKRRPPTVQSRLPQIEEIRAHLRLDKPLGCASFQHRTHPENQPSGHSWRITTESIRDSQEHASWYVRQVCRHYLGYPSALLYTRPGQCHNRVIASFIASVYEKLMKRPYPLVDPAFAWEPDPQLRIGWHSIAIWRVLVYG